MKILRFEFILISLFLCICNLNASNAYSVIEFQKDSIEMGDRIMVKWSFLYPSGSVTMPSFDTLGNFQILHQSATTNSDTLRAKLASKYLHLQQFEPGTYSLNGLPLFWKHDNMTDTIYSLGNVLYVKAIPIDTTKDIKPAKGPIRIPYTWKEIALILGAILLILALIIGFFYWLSNRKKVPKEVKPKITRSKSHEIALKKLQKMDSQKKWQNDDSKEFYLELSDIIREYIEGRFHIPAKENTTAEIIQSFRPGLIDEPEKLILNKILEVSDLAKFAKWKPLTDENYAALKDAILFVKRTKPQAETKEIEE